MSAEDGVKVERSGCAEKPWEGGRIDIPVHREKEVVHHRSKRSGNKVF